MQVLPAPDRITILTAPKPSGSACPLCGAVLSRVHSHYTRTLADLPWQGRAVTVQVRARRFRCATAGCLRQVFSERLPKVAPSWARRTARLDGIQRHIGLALGGEPGARLALALEVPMAQVAQTAACNGQHQVQQRLARWLLLAHDRVDGDELALKQDALSTTLACRRSGVTIALALLEEAGAIRRGRARVVVQNRAALKAAACGCYGRVQAFAEAVDASSPDQVRRPNAEAVQGPLSAGDRGAHPNAG